MHFAHNYFGYNTKFVKKGMEKNIGYNDKMTRVIIAIFIGMICLTQSIAAPIAINLLLIAELLLLTSSLGFCPLYKVARINNYKD